MTKPPKAPNKSLAFSVTLFRWPSAEFETQWLSIKIFQKVILPELMATRESQTPDQSQGRDLSTPESKKKHESLGWNKWIQNMFFLGGDCKTQKQFHVEHEICVWNRNQGIGFIMLHHSQMQHRDMAAFENSDWNLEVQIAAFSHARSLTHKFLWIFQLGNPQNLAQQNLTWDVAPRPGASFDVGHTYQPSLAIDYGLRIVSILWNLEHHLIH